jgi:hypothetical protein
MHQAQLSSIKYSYRALGPAGLAASRNPMGAGHTPWSRVPPQGDARLHGRMDGQYGLDRPTPPSEEAKIHASCPNAPSARLRAALADVAKGLSPEPRPTFTRLKERWPQPRPAAFFRRSLGRRWGRPPEEAGPVSGENRQAGGRRARPCRRTIEAGGHRRPRQWAGRATGPADARLGEMSSLNRRKATGTSRQG